MAGRVRWFSLALAVTAGPCRTYGLAPAWRRRVWVLTACIGLAACRRPTTEVPSVTTRPEVVIPEPVPTQEDEETEAPLPPRVAVEPRSEPPTSRGVGVPECDEFLAKYEHCIREVMSPDMQSGMLQAMDQMRESFRNMLEVNEPGVVAKSCAQIDDVASQSMRAMGCAW